MADSGVFMTAVRSYNLLGCLLTVTLLWAQPVARAQDKVTCPLYVEVPCVVRLTATDNQTTTQALDINASNISFDANLTANGVASATWKGNTNSNNGFIVTIQRSSIGGTASDELKSDISVSAVATPGGDNDVTVLSGYGEGKPLTAISEAKPEQFCKTSRPGSALFTVETKLNAPASHGKGSINATLTFCAASL